MKIIGEQLTRSQQLTIKGGVAPGGSCTITCKDSSDTVLGSTTTDNCNTGNNLQKCKDAGHSKVDTATCSCVGGNEA